MSKAPEAPAPAEAPPPNVERPAPPPVSAGGSGAPPAADAGAPPPLAPPPMRGKKPGLGGGGVPSLSPGGPAAAGPLPTEWNGRATYDDLFVSDPTPAPAGRANPEEKVEYFREKLKRAETQAARFRDAWQARERELDTLEALLKKEQGQVEQERATGAELSQKIAAMEKFLEQKKQEFEAYGQKVTAAFAQKDEQERALKQQLERAQGEAQQQLQDKDGDIAGLQQQLAALQGDMEALQNARQSDVQNLSAQIAALEQEKQTLQSSQGDMAHELEVARTELVESRDALERDVAVRNEAIEKLKASIEKQREAILERDTQIDQLSVQVAQTNQELAAVRVESENREGSFLQEKSTLEGQVVQAQQDAEAASVAAAEDVRVRDEVIEKLKTAVQTQRASLEERNGQIEQLQQETDAARAQLQGELDTTRAQLQGELDTVRGQMEQDVQAARQELAARQAEAADADAQIREQVEELNRGISLRDEAIEKLKATVEASRTRLAELQEQLNAVQEQAQDSAGLAGQERERTADIVSRTRKALEVAQKLLT